MARLGIIASAAALGVLVSVALALSILTGNEAATGQEGKGFRIAPSPRPPVNRTILGVHFAPTDTLVERGIQQSVDEICPDGRFDVTDGTGFLPPPPTYVPPGTVLDSSPPNLLAIDVNPFALVCPSTGQLYRAALSYTLPTENGPPSEISIVRVVDPNRSFPTTATADQVRVVLIGSREAVLVDTSIAGQLGLPDMPNLTLVFPQPDGYLALVTHGIATEEFFKIAESLTIEAVQ
jgi:hypothetical protein